jgi:hypothetical protein
MVVDDPAEAARLVAQGRSVVLLVAAEMTPVAGMRSGPGRLALFVASPADPASWQVARAMASELFGLTGS